MQNLRIDNVQYLDRYKLNISLSNGHKILFDLEPKLKTARFQELMHEEIFKRGTIVDGKIIRWTEQVEISLEELLLNLSHETNNKGR